LARCQSPLHALRSELTSIKGFIPCGERFSIFVSWFLFLWKPFDGGELYAPSKGNVRKLCRNPILCARTLAHAAARLSAIWRDSRTEARMKEEFV